MKTETRKELINFIINYASDEIETVKDALKIAQKADDEVTADLLIGRMGVHEKAAWMLKSTAA